METLLPISFGFAAGAMLTLVAIELAPPRRTDASRCLLLSQAPSPAPWVMIALAVTLGV